MTSSTALLIGEVPETFVDEARYYDYLQLEKERKGNEDYKRRINFLNKSDDSLSILHGEIKTSEGVYLDIDYVKSKTYGDTMKKSNIPDDEHVMFLDMNLTLLKPKQFYKDLLEQLGLDPTKCDASVDGFNFHQRPNGKYSVYPKIVGGGLNPYMKYKSNRSTASRRLPIFDNLSRLTGKKVFVMSLNLTLPKIISDLLFSDPLGQKLHQEMLDLFWKKILTKEIYHPDDINQEHPLNILTVDDATRKSTKNLELCRMTNIHEWSSKNPFESQIHSHNLFPNFLWSNEEERHIRIKPSIKKFALLEIKKLWYDCQKEVLGYGSLTKTQYSKYDFDYNSLNIWFNYKQGYHADIEFPTKPDKPKATSLDPKLARNDIADYDDAMHTYKNNKILWKKNTKARSQILHLLKYNTRSHLIDIANYLDYFDADLPNSLEDFTYKFNQLKHFYERGSFKNRTQTTGYARKMKKIIKLLDWDLYVAQYNVGTGKLKIEDRDTLTDACTSEEIPKKPDRNITFTDLKHVTVYSSYKSDVIRLGVLNFTKKSDFFHVADNWEGNYYD